MRVKKQLLWPAVLGAVVLAALAAYFLISPASGDPGQFAGFYGEDQIYGLEGMLSSSLDMEAGEAPPDPACTVLTDPWYRVTPEGELFFRHGQISAGRLTGTRLTRKSFDQLFTDELLVWKDGKNIAGELRRQNRRAWRAEVTDEDGLTRFFLLMEQKDGRLLMAWGLREAGERGIGGLDELVPRRGGTALTFLEPEDTAGAAALFGRGTRLGGEMELDESEAGRLGELLAQREGWTGEDPGLTFTTALVLYSAAGREVYFLDLSAGRVCAYDPATGGALFAALTEGERERLGAVLAP